MVGATSGIGLEVARLLWNQGSTVGIAGRREERLLAFKKECGERVEYFPIDVTASDASERLVALIEKIGGADTIILCAGVGSQNLGLDPEVELQTVETNVVGFTRMATAAFCYFWSVGGGHIAVISSIAGTKGLGVAAAYSASKRFQNTYIESLAQLSSMQGCNVCFTDIRPGFVDTDLLKSGKFPMLMRPERVAQQIVRALKRRRHVVVIDWRYRILVVFWRLIPRCLWVRLKVKN